MELLGGVRRERKGLGDERGGRGSCSRTGREEGIRDGKGGGRFGNGNLKSKWKNFLNEGFGGLSVYVEGVYVEGRCLSLRRNDSFLLFSLGRHVVLTEYNLLVLKKVLSSLCVYFV